MKQTKKLIALASIAVMLVMVIVASALSSAAWWPGSDKLYETVGYGTFTDGIPFTNHVYLYPAIEIDGGPNLDFEKGLEYWITGSTRYVEAVTETVDGKQNTFIRLLPEKLYNGAKSVLFPVSKLKEGDTPGILYKWRGDSHAVQVTLKEVYSIINSGGQWNSAKTEWVGHNGAQGTKSIWTADEDNESEWNIQLAINYNPVQPLSPDSLSDKTYYFVGVEAFAAPEISYGFEIDDIQIVIHNQQSGLVSDLDGKTLYNLNNLPKRDVVNYMFGDLDDTDENAKEKNDVNKILAKLDSTPKTTNNIFDNIVSSTDDDDATAGYLIWIIVAAAVILLLAAGAVVLIIIKKKKSSTAEKQKEE